MTGSSLGAHREPQESELAVPHHDRRIRSSAGGGLSDEQPLSRASPPAALPPAAPQPSRFTENEQIRQPVHLVAKRLWNTTGYGEAVLLPEMDRRPVDPLGAVGAVFWPGPVPIVLRRPSSDRHIAVISGRWRIDGNVHCWLRYFVGSIRFPAPPLSSPGFSGAFFFSDPPQPGFFITGRRTPYGQVLPSRAPSGAPGPRRFFDHCRIPRPRV